MPLCVWTISIAAAFAMMMSPGYTSHLGKAAQALRSSEGMVSYGGANQQRLGFGSRITDKTNYRNFVWLNK
jgi:hypothetical protein